MRKIRIAVLASGSGTNLQAIIDSCESGYIPGEVVVVISNKEDAYALERARNKNIPAYFINPKDYSSREEYDMAIGDIIEKYEADLIAMAGYMLLLSPKFIARFRLKIMNIHPALCPSFPGTHAIRDAYDYGVKVTGVTVHFADEGMDTGPIILQYPVFVDEGDSFEALEEKIHKIEHQLYPLAIKLFAEGKLKISGRKVEIMQSDWKKLIKGVD